MQQVTVQEQVDYASVGWRFAAVLIDTAVLACIWIAVIIVDMMVLIGQSDLDPNDPAAAQELSREITQKIWDQQLGNSSLLFYVLLFGSLFVYYLIQEMLFAASVGKLACRMRVTMVDGSRPTGSAILVRNLVRVPEALFFYGPAGISCVSSPRRQRLGDHAARTVVVRRRTVAGAAGQGWPAPAPPAAAPTQAPAAFGQPAQPAQATPPAPVAGWVAPSASPETAAVPSLDDTVAALKTAALAARGAHLNYLRFSERELATGEDHATGYSEEYVSAWFTLADAVTSLRATRAAATVAATAAGQTLDEACAAQPDLAHLLGELAPYTEAVSDEEIHAAFLAVARAEAPGS